ncbi:unnamed protein product [Effrenium voratum]|nr:unnamed protein product [Effrenium voratum]
MELSLPVAAHWGPRCPGIAVQRHQSLGRPEIGRWQRGALLVPLLVRGRVRRRAKEDKTGVEKWFDKKKNEATAGVGGAVVGGMLGGPLGAMVGAQVASKMGPVLNSALDSLEDEEPAEAEQATTPEKKEEAPKPEVTKPSSESSRPKAAAPKARSAPEAARSAPEAPKRPAVPSGQDELQRLQQGLKTKQRRLEEEVAELYAKAEQALQGGDEAAAREFLEARSKSQAKLESLLEGRQRRAQTLQQKAEEIVREGGEGAPGRQGDGGSQVPSRERRGFGPDAPGWLRSGFAANRLEL